MKVERGKKGKKGKKRRTVLAEKMKMGKKEDGGGGRIRDGNEKEGRGEGEKRKERKRRREVGTVTFFPSLGRRGDGGKKEGNEKRIEWKGWQERLILCNNEKTQFILLKKKNLCRFFHKDATLLFFPLLPYLAPRLS